MLLTNHGVSEISIYGSNQLKSVHISILNVTIKEILLSTVENQEIA